MRLLIAGDLVPTESNINLFENGEVDKLLGEELLAIWNSADKRIFNLELPLTDRNTPIIKCGPNLSVPSKVINGIKKLNPTLITLANNHILDHGVVGLKSTENILKKYDIPYVGVGDSLNDAKKPYIIEENGLKIGIYACAENEFSIATDSSAGANPFDPLESLDHIYDLKKQCDYVIVLYHGGKEHYRYPSPNLQKVCRKLVEKGADLVVCQHSHCIGCEEIYKDSTIIYGQGNFIFDYSESDFWKTSILLQVNIEHKLSVEYIPIVKVNNTVSLADADKSKVILKEFFQRSNEIKEEKFIENNYERFAGQMFDSYLIGFHGDNIVYRIMNKISRGKLTKQLYSQKSLLWIRNIIECEAHRELVLNYLSRGKKRE